MRTAPRAHAPVGEARLELAERHVGSGDHISHVPAMVASHPVGHLGTFDQANGGAEAQVTLRWLQWQLDGDAGAARLFAGKSCGLCSDPAWTVRRKGL